MDAIHPAHVGRPITAGSNASVALIWCEYQKTCSSANGWTSSLYSDTVANLSIYWDHSFLRLRLRWRHPLWCSDATRALFSARYERAQRSFDAERHHRRRGIKCCNTYHFERMREEASGQGQSVDLGTHVGEGAVTVIDGE